MGVMACLSQGGPSSPSASSTYVFSSLFAGGAKELALIHFIEAREPSAIQRDVAGDIVGTCTMLDILTEVEPKKTLNEVKDYYEKTKPLNDLTNRSKDD